MKRSIITLTAVATLATGGLAYGQSRQFGTVISVTPVTAQVQVPRQTCNDQSQLLQAQPSGAGAVVGGVLGGLAGNAIGAGVGRALATGAGVVAGAVAGNAVETATAPAIPVTTTNCVYSPGVESRIVAFDVVYTLNGERYTTRTQRDPGPRIALDMRPAGEVPSGSPYGSPDDAPQADLAQANVAPNPYAAPAPYPAPYPVPVPVATYPDYPYAYPYPYGYGAYPVLPFSIGIGFGGRYGGGWHGHR